MAPRLRQFHISRELFMKVNKLPWYFANLALRIRPVAAQGIQRDVPPEGAMIAGRFIPGGVQPN